MTPVDFDVAGSDFAAIGWNPEGRVHFSYAVAIAADGSGFTAGAGADIDGNGLIQLWGFTQPDGLGALVAGGVGCNPTMLVPATLGPCSVSQNTF